MSDTAENPVINLKLFIDEEKKKVVFAETGKDFVDVLFNFLTLPMGTIVRMMEKYQKSESIAIGCFNNIYASVANMGIEHFRTEACKQMLLYPRSLNQEKCRNLKLKIDDYDASKCFMCPMFGNREECSKSFSGFNTSRCSCGKLMSKVIEIDDEGQGRVKGHTSFIITDDLKVEVTSAMSTFNILKTFGYEYCYSLVEKVHDVNLEEVATLLESLFTSDTPLTDTFLKKSNSKRIHKMLSPALSEVRDESKADQTITLNAFVNKKEGNILYVGCDEDFVDLLFTFLAMPLESVWETSSYGIIFGCIGNLCRSFKNLSVDYGRETKCVLPYYYKCQKQLLEAVTTHKPSTYYRYLSVFREYRLTANSGKGLVYGWDKLVPVTGIDPKSEDDCDTADELSTPSGGFLKEGIKFMVTDQLSITPSISASTIGLLKEEKIRLDDVEVQVIIIRKEEAIRLLEASLMTSSALSTAILGMESASTSEGQNRVSKKAKIDT